MKIRVCENCSKKFDFGQMNCPYCGSLKFVDYEILEKKPTKKCSFCEKEYDLSYKSCPYCGSTKVVKEEVLLKEDEVVNEKIDEEKEEIKDLFIEPKGKICEECGNKYSSNLESCPYCGSTKSTQLSAPSSDYEKKVNEESKKRRKRIKNKKDRSDYLKGFYIGTSSDLVEHSILMEEKKINKKTKEGMNDGFIFTFAIFIGAILLGLVIGLIEILLNR